MKSALLVIAQDMFRDEEYAEPKAVLESRRAQVITASVAAGPATGRFGLDAVASVALADIADEVFDAVVFIGGGGASVFFDDADAHRLARATHDAGRVIAAICIAPSTLAHAGLLDGVQATAFPSQEADLVAHGAIWTGAPVTIDGRIVTGDGPQSATAFGSAIADLMELPSKR